MNICEEYIDQHKQLIERLSNLRHCEISELYTPLNVKNFGKAQYMIEFYPEPINAFIGNIVDSGKVEYANISNNDREVIKKCHNLLNDILLAAMAFSNNCLDKKDIVLLKNKYNTLIHSVNYSSFLTTVVSQILKFFDVTLNHVMIEERKHNVSCHYGRFYFNDKTMFFDVVKALTSKDISFDNTPPDLYLMSIMMPPDNIVAYMMENGLYYADDSITETHCITLDWKALTDAKVATLISLHDDCKELKSKKFMKPSIPSIFNLVVGLVAQKALDSGAALPPPRQHMDVYLSEHTDNESLAHFLFKWHDYIVHYKKLTRPKDLPNDFYKNKR